MQRLSGAWLITASRPNSDAHDVKERRRGITANKPGGRAAATEAQKLRAVNRCRVAFVAHPERRREPAPRAQSGALVIAWSFLWVVQAICASCLSGGGWALRRLFRFRHIATIRTLFAIRAEIRATERATASSIAACQRDDGSEPTPESARSVNPPRGRSHGPDGSGAGHSGDM